jgi:uncharacterized protein (TIGR02118 family)
MIKFAYLINRVEGMSVEAFVDHHRNKHAPLFTSIPEAQKYVRRYAVSHPVAAPNYPAPAFDGLTEIWFDSWADHDAFFSSKNYLETVKPDEPTFIDFASVGVMVTEERLVMG